MDYSIPDHTVTNMQLIPIEKIFSSRDSIRKARAKLLSPMVFKMLEMKDIS